MIILIIVLLLVTVLFEVTLREIFFLSDISFLFIMISLFFWYRRYRVAIICGVIASILIDLVLQNHLGKTLFSLFCPLLILAVFDNLLWIESKLSRIVFSILSTVLSIFVSDLLFELVFFRGEFLVGIMVKRMIISIIVLILLNLFLGGLLLPGENSSKKYR